MSNKGNGGKELKIPGENAGDDGATATAAPPKDEPKSASKAPEAPAAQPQAAQATADGRPIIVQVEQGPKRGVVRRGSPGSTGMPYINMLNTQGVATPVIRDMIIQKLLHGYRFIRGESAVPSRSQANGPVEQRKDVVARNHPQPANREEALELLRLAISTGPDADIRVVPKPTADDEVSRLLNSLGVPVE